MVGDPTPRGSRRSPLPPAMLHGEVVRARLVDALAARFDVDVTVLVAGAGFGKTTALAQAIRANDAAPRGIDAWVACEPGDDDARRLARAIVLALGGRAAPADDPMEQAVEALRAVAPVDVCLVLDDLHELSPDSPGERLVVDLAARLPAHAHLVLASRVPVPVPLARRRAAGQLVELDDTHLAFTDGEVDALARLVGGEGTACRDLAGWPSLVRLVLSAPAGATRQFLWEEIVTRLGASDRAGLLALATLGSGSADELAAVADRTVDAETLVARVPLLHRDAQDRYGAHHLWDDAVVRLFTPAEVADARRRALVVLAERGDTVRLGAAACRWGDARVFRQACVTLVRDELGAFPITTGRRWIDDAPDAAVGSPEHALLAVALRQAEGRDLAGADDELDALVTRFAERQDGPGQMAALAVASVVAHGRGDTLRLLALAERIRALPGAPDEPLGRFFVRAVDAALASLAGDAAGAVALLEGIDYDQVPSRTAELVVRLHVTMLTLAGRADETAALAARLRSSSNAYVRAMPPMLRWAAGDPSHYLTARPDRGEPADMNARDRFVRAAHLAAVAAAFGDRDLLTSLRLDAHVADAAADPRDSAAMAVALALRGVAEGDEGGAAAAIDEHLARYPLDVRLGDTHLHRHVAVPYVLSDAVRRRWDAAPVGPVHARALRLARALLAGRAGTLDPAAPLDDAAFVVCALPLPWSVELAVRAHAAGHPDAVVLARALGTWFAEPVASELRRLTAQGGPVGAAAAALAARHPEGMHRTPLEVDVLGPLRVRVGDCELDGADLRRARVRTLLALLVVAGPQRRERVADLLWPALGADAAAQNLRVTLSRLRRALRIDGHHPDTWLEVAGDRIGLAGPPRVDTDVARFTRHREAAAAARAAGDTAAEQDELAAAVGCWREGLGDGPGSAPVADLDTVDEVRGERERLRRELVAATLRLGELHLVAGRREEALALAERARTAAPFDERAHRLAMAAYLRGTDPDGLRRAVEATLAALADLGVEPEPATRMLVRNAEVRLRGVHLGAP